GLRAVAAAADGRARAAEPIIPPFSRSPALTQSMTAFARGTSETPLGKLTMEVRSVNNRYLDIALRLSDSARHVEPAIREAIADRIKRGRVELSLRIDASVEGADESRLNSARLDALVRMQDAVREMLPKSRRLSVREVLDWPGVVQREEADEDTLKGLVLELLDRVFDEFVDTRRREGARLAELIVQRVDAARALVATLRSRLPEIQAHMRERLDQRIAEIAERVDPERVEQEVVLLLNKADVEEETDRLTIHLDEVVNVLGQDQPVGRRLDFLMQELNREANTLGSKAAHTDVTNASVELKVLIEQMREQVQNIE